MSKTRNRFSSEVSRTRFRCRIGLIEVSKEDRNMTDNFGRKLLLMGLW